MASEGNDVFLKDELHANGNLERLVFPARRDQLEASPTPKSGAAIPLQHSASNEDFRLDYEREAIDQIKKGLQALGGEVTDIESVIAKTSLSKAQVLECFGNMHSVVIALVESLATEMSAPLKVTATVPPLREILHKFGSRITMEDSKWQLNGLYRIALTESIRNREIGEEFYRRGPGLLTSELSDLIKRYQAEGEVRDGDSYILASQFMAILRLNLEPREEADADGHSDVSKIVDMFCSGIQKGVKPCAS
ncbi:TetR/AcrR family transcriptional regulator C-terminal domain-containing protein [Pseudomonas rustica]|uniref:TetR/AcrR family transcriptional regulator C-terminal domain-containing protein n=1 Tax=Pseudomonas rustica TaxID=2827099 RepID=UPI003CEB44C3